LNGSPGIPPIWSPPRIAPRLKPDTGSRYVDQNTDRYPWSPLEPLIRAVLEMQPNFDLGMMDIVTDRRPLRRLFAFVSGDGEDFEFGVESIGTTLLFARMEKQTRDLIPEGRFQGYRQAFEEEYTKLEKSAKGSTSHHRIVHYDFGGLRLLVRSAVDAYIGELAPTLDQETSQHSQQDGDEDLVKFIKVTSLGRAAPSIIETPKAPGLTVIPGGQNVPLSAVTELKTRSKFAKKPFNLTQKMPDLWISQTPNFIDAAHQNVGTKWSRAKYNEPRLAEFMDIDIKPMTEDLAEWETENAKTIYSFLIVLRQIIDTARSMETPCIVRYEKDKDVLLVSKAESGVVPIQVDVMKEKWFVGPEPA